VNTMIGSGYFNGKVTIKGGSQWRPVVHVKDVVKAIYLALHVKSPGHRIYNVGSNKQNYQIETLGTLIAEALPNAELVYEQDSRDVRSYKVDFSLIEEDLRLRTAFTIADAVSEFYDAFDRGIIRNMNEDVYYRVKHLAKFTGNDEILKLVPDKSYYLPLNARRKHYDENQPH
jgi:dTDP-D-glucose 4,6-dehydratase